MLWLTIVVVVFVVVSTLSSLVFKQLQLFCRENGRWLVVAATKLFLMLSFGSPLVAIGRCHWSVCLHLMFLLTLQLYSTLLMTVVCGCDSKVLAWLSVLVTVGRATREMSKTNRGS